MPTQHHVTRSTMITEIEYDAEKQLLWLVFGKGGKYVFGKGGKYEYKDVPKDIYEGLLGAESIGKYFLANVKGSFETEKC